MTTRQPTTAWPRPATRRPNGVLPAERDQELRLLDRLLLGLRSPSPAPSVVLVEGTPGLGRSTLLRKAAATAGRAGILVLSAQCTRAESGLRYGVLSQLFASVPEADNVLSGLRRPSEDPGNHAQLHRLRTEFFGVAARHPVLLVVDDAQWADAESADWLVSLTRRLGDVPVVVLLSSGPAGTPGSALGYLEPHSLARGHRRHGRSDHLIRLEPLSPAGVAQTLAAHGHPEPVSPALARTVTDTCRGNPAVLTAALGSMGSGPDHGDGQAADARWLEDFRACANEAFVRLNAAMAEDLPDEALALLRALAVCRDDLDPDQVYRIAGLGVPGGARAMSSLRSLGLLTGGERPVAVCAAAAYTLTVLSPPERESLYARAAELGRRTGIDHRRLARLLLGAPSFRRPWVAGVLRRAAAEHRSDGDDRTAVRILEHALGGRFGPGDRAQLHIDLGLAKAGSDPAGSQRHLELAVTYASEPDLGRLRLRAADLLAVLQGPDAPSGPFAPSGLRPFTSGTSRTGFPWSGRPAGGTAPDPLSDPARAGLRSWYLAVTGEGSIDVARALAMAAVHSGSADAPPTGAAPYSPRISAAGTLMLTGDLDKAVGALDTVVADALRSGERAPAVMALLTRAAAYRGLERSDRAAADLDKVTELMRARRHHHLIAPLVAAAEASLHVAAGDYHRAERVLSASVPPGTQESVAAAAFLFARGEVRLATGRPEAALEDLLGCGRRLTALGWTNPALPQWRGRAALLSHELGDRSQSARLAAADLRLARVWGAEGAIARAAHVSRLVAGSSAGSGPPDTRRDLAAAPAPPRPPGAAAPSGWRPPERRTTIRVPAPVTTNAPAAGLTPAEARVAERAARGLPNRHIAEELSITRRTVELHLTRVYRKLGISGRTELSSAHAGAGQA